MIKLSWVKIAGVLGIIFGLGITACAPALISYKHVCFQESDHVRVMERSTDSTDSQNKPVYFPKIGLPTRLRVTNEKYTIDIFTPINPTPVVFLNAINRNGKKLSLRGNNLVELKNQVDKYEYSFFVEDAHGEALTILVLDGESILGEEILPYKIRSRGFVVYIDAL